MPTRQQVRDNVRSVLRGLRIDSSNAELCQKEEKCLAELKPLFTGIDCVTWPSGLSENN